MAISKRSYRKKCMLACYLPLTIITLNQLSNYDFFSISFTVLAVVLIVLWEDCLLFATEVVPTIQDTSPLDLVSLIVELLILVAWWLSFSFVIKYPNNFLITFALFSFFKFLAGLLHWNQFPESLNWRCHRYFCFLIVPGASLFCWYCFVDSLGWKYFTILSGWGTQTLLWWGITGLGRERDRVLENKRQPKSRRRHK